MRQASSDFEIFERLWDINPNDRHEYRALHFQCHALQHFQMATEKLAKAMLLFIDPAAEVEKSHVAFRKII